MKQLITLLLTTIATATTTICSLPTKEQDDNTF